MPWKWHHRDTTRRYVRGLCWQQGCDREPSPNCQKHLVPSREVNCANNATPPATWPFVLCSSAITPGGANSLEMCHRPSVEFCDAHLPLEELPSQELADPTGTLDGLCLLSSERALKKPHGFNCEALGLQLCPVWKSRISTSSTTPSFHRWVKQSPNRTEYPKALQRTVIAPSATPIENAVFVPPVNSTRPVPLRWSH